jgi:hypothetical protein
MPIKKAKVTPRSEALSPRLELSLLGPTPQAALRNVADEFERRGWNDDAAAALSVIRQLEGDGGASTWKMAARAVPQMFLSSNRVLRRDLEDALKSAAKRR